MSKKVVICEKALDLFCERGYDNTPMSHIAKAIGASKAILYHYFSNKEELLFSIIEYQMEKYLTPILDDAAQIEDPEQRLRYFIKGYTRLLANDSRSRIMVHEAHRLDPEHSKIIQARHNRLYQLIYDTIAEMEAQGKVRAPQKAFTTFAAIGMCSWTFYWFDYQRKELADQLADTFADLFFNGILNSCGDTD
ncbi:TetR/AcrR family transcriptional regulator [Desulfosarcina ovata]|uniref:TetR family transcriptional regulator n=2 Tax=Desulfosarcina ovata TaxID=83564 RepID=A0A5K8ALC8_9BACT|nr:TetR/AcrR family transcriptional regulator [Desulfosarcina ovata]BBO86582.1 TetR family transcriptional regulator [Desulfosarcina ovata subsp. sediminis]BBO93438.1 TetR family transcriptional regulator [Desulfosarcina ovata subsp. ovata]